MKRLFFAGFVCVLLVFSSSADTLALKQAQSHETSGQFKVAAVLLHRAIATSQSSSDRRELEFELDRLARIKKDYSLNRDEFFKALSISLRDLTPGEFDNWVKLGWFDTRDIDGTNYFFKDGVSNLYFRHSELDSRRIGGRDNREKELFRLGVVNDIKQAALAEGSPYVLPKTIHVNMSVIVDRNVAATNEQIRAWLPIPRRNAFQSDFKLLSTSVPPKALAPEDSPIRSIYFEQPSQGTAPTEFDIAYDYNIRGVYFDLHPDKIQPYDPNDDAIKHFTGEAPHVVFTPEIKALSKKIVGTETNPMLKAKKIFDWQSDNLQYSYAREYSTLTNISDYCRSHGYGDCGQQALLFITLCRFNGVPARWQTGWDLTPNSTTIHDWTEIYLAPYGWVPVDPYMGNYAMRYITTLTPAQKIEIRDFYFGGLDQYRMIANSDHDQTLSPPKQSFRSDDVDFQRAELEHNGTNIYFDQFSFHLKYKIVPPPAVP